MRIYLAVLVLFFMVSVSANATTLSILGGQAVSNSLSDEKSNAWGVEQEMNFKHNTWQFGYMNEGHKSNGQKRDGIYAMYKLASPLTSKLTTSISAGPYFTATTVNDQVYALDTTDEHSLIINPGAYHDSYGLALLASAEAKYQVSALYDVGARWEHVMLTQHSLDADVFFVEFGRKF